MLIRLGEYQPGNDSLTDAAVEAQDAINGYLQQAMRAPSGFEQTCFQLSEVSRYAPSR
jgi:type III secretion protein N (ATPase)